MVVLVMVVDAEERGERTNVKETGSAFSCRVAFRRRRFFLWPRKEALEAQKKNH